MSKQLLTSFILFFMLIASQVMAQNKTISGTVTGEDGTGIPGINVYIKSSTTGTLTDINGKYTIEATSGVTLIFSGVGYDAQEILVGNQTSINITLKEKVLEAVVKTGYRETTAEKLTGAVSVVDATSIEQVPMATFDQILQGQAPGLVLRTENGQPGTAGRVTIRGQATLLNVLGSNEPLYIMDGMPISDNVFASLNPNDIESVSVLKDAAEASAYGSRGGNGVIVITTKQGSKGKTQLNYRFQQGWSVRTRDQFQMMNTTQKIDYEKSLAEFQYQQAIDSGTDPTTAANSAGTGRAGVIWERTLAGHPDPLSVDEANTLLGEFSDINVDWRDEFFRTGKFQSHEISARGGTEKTTFFASLAYFRQEGQTISSDLERITSRINLTHYASKSLSLGVNLTVNGSKSNFIQSGGVNLNNPFAAVYLNNPYERVRDPETGEYEIPAIGRNMIRETLLNENSRNEFKGVGSIFLEYALPWVEGLTVKTTWGIDYTRRNDTFFADTESVWGQDPGVSVGGQGRLDRDLNEIFRYNGTTQIRYNKSFGDDKHEIDAYIANEVFSTRSTGFGWNGYGLNPKLGTSPAGVSNADATFFPSVSGFGTENRLVSFFGDVIYTYDGKYSVKVGLRRDGSSKFGDDQRFATFWNAGFNWNAKAESFLENVDFLSSLNVRFSYGRVGNQLGIGNFQALDIWDSAISYRGNQGIRPTNPANPDLSWETVETFNFGVDFGFFKNRISGSIDVYQGTTIDLFLQQSLSLTSGFGSLNINAGEMRNRGVELQLNTTNLKFKDFTWSTNFNLAYNQNEITDLGQVEEFIQGTAIVREGLPAGAHYLPHYAGVDPATGNEMFYDLNNNVVFTAAEEDNRAFGTNNPPFSGGITNTFTYGNSKIGTFQLSIFGNWLTGHQLVSNVNWILIGPSVGQFANWGQPAYMANFWREPGQVTNIPRPGASNEFSSRYLERGDFFRIKNVTVSYSLPSDWVKKIGLRSVRVYGQGQNLFTFTEYTGFDPDINNNINQFEYPTPRIFTVGVDVGF